MLTRSAQAAQVTGAPRRTGAGAIAAMCAAVLACVSACGAAAAAPQSGQGPGRCRLSAAIIPAGLPGFAKYRTLSRMPFPGRPRPGAPPSLAQREYLCGEAEGFLTGISLTGKYRRENNEQARRLGYKAGKWPSTPLSGAIVTEQRHKVLEVYVSVFQFRSAQAAEAYVHPPRPGPQVTGGLAFQLRPRPLGGLHLPGVAAFRQPLGTSPTKDEMDITVKLPLKNYVLVLALCGGESFDWNDAAPYWEKVHAMVGARLEGGIS
jgi:hypothetical protein